MVRSLNTAENELLSASARRASVYVEMAKPGYDSNFCSDGHPQHVDAYTGQAGVLGLTQIDVCRMGDMRTAMALTSADGGGGINVVSVRVQTGTESFGHPSEVYRTGDSILGISLIAAYNPFHGTGSRRAAEKTLMCAVWHGTVPNSTVRLFVSNNAGRTWAQVWVTDGGGHYMEQPKLLTHSASGYVYLFFSDNTVGAHGSLRYFRADANPESWTAGTFAWSAGPTTITAFTGTVDNRFSIYHDDLGWLLALSVRSGASAIVKVGTNPSATPEGGSYTFLPNTHYGAITWVRVCRTGGHDEFGHFPAGRILLISSAEYGIVYSVTAQGATAWNGFNGYGLFDAQGTFWQSANSGYYENWNLPASVEYNTRLDNREVWNSILTPSTSVTYGSDTVPFSPFSTPWVKIDNHGPTGGDDDVADHFASFWTRSNERMSVVIPPFDPAHDVQIDFWLKFHKSAYHNIWFVIDDPLHPNNPLFKIDYYVGHDASGGHAHDTARGCAIWFGGQRATVPDHPVSNPGAGHGVNPSYYQHPLDNCFSGFASAASNAGPWYFRILYDHTADVWKLLWATTPSGPYVAFNPYGDREYMDIGTTDTYVASSTQKYHTRPRGEVWPSRFYIGCPETKPAIEKQSGVTIGQLRTQDTSSPVSSFASGAGCLVPRLSGGIDLWYVDFNHPDTILRTPFGYDWVDVWTAQSWQSSWSMNGGPDQATLTLEDIDNSNRYSLYGNARGNYVMMWARAGSLERGTSQLWGRWVCPYFGTADTGEATDSGDGPQIVMRMLSPLRSATRTHRTQTFTSLPPPEPLDTEGDPQDPGTPVEDVPKVRTQDIIYLVDFDHPADPALNLFDDYIAAYVWQIMCGQDLTKLAVPRVGLQPTNFVVNSSGVEADVWEDLRRLWDDLGLVWFYDYFAGGLLHAFKRTQLQGTGTAGLAAADLILEAWHMISAPLTQGEDDWGRSGQVNVSAQNVEDRPNVGVARVAPWPDGAGTIDKSLDIVGHLASQWALADMYKKDLPLQALYKEWESARQRTPDVEAFPYLQPTMHIWIKVENPAWPPAYKAYINSRYGKLVRLWLVYGVETSWDGQSFTSKPLLIDPEVFPV